AAGVPVVGERVWGTMPRQAVQCYPDEARAAEAGSGREPTPPGRVVILDRSLDRSLDFAALWQRRRRDPVLLCEREAELNQPATIDGPGLGVDPVQVLVDRGLAQPEPGPGQRGAATKQEVIEDLLIAN